MTTIRNQTKLDFTKRSMRVDTGHHGLGAALFRDATPTRPVGSLLTGFTGAYLVMAISGNRDMLETSLRSGTLTPEAQSYIMMALAALLSAATVLLAVHLLRTVIARGGKRRNSRFLLGGVLGAVVLAHTPPGVWKAGFDMMDDNSRSFVMAASATVQDALPRMDFGNAAFVSSQGR